MCRGLSSAQEHEADYEACPSLKELRCQLLLSCQSGVLSSLTTLSRGDVILACNVTSIS